MTIANLVEQLDGVLAEIDADLASVPLAFRPFQVAVTLVEKKILEVSTDGGATCYEPDGSAKFAVTPWFRSLYEVVEGWYRIQYGAAFDQTSENGISAVVLIRGTPFALRVPTNRVRPAEPGKTIWLSFPDHIESDEVATDWIVKPPNLERLEAPVRAALDSNICEIAGALRFVRTNLMGVPDDDDALAGFRNGVMTHLERAAELILEAKGDNVQKAWWELQMTIESALKGLLLQKTGHYPFTHKINELFDAAKPTYLSFDHSSFNGWPEQAEMSGLRYAQGTRRDIASVFEAYRLTLGLAVTAVDAMTRMRFGNAQFKLQRPPWKRDEDAELERNEGETA